MPERSSSTRAAPAGAGVGDTARGVAPEQLRASAPASEDSRLAPAFEALGAPGVEAVSVDVFDTLLWRKLPEPVDAFVLLGQRLAADGALADDVTPGVFAKLREAAEKRAREVSSGRGRGVEIGLRDIYARLPARVFRGALSTDDLVEREVELERSLLVADLDIVELLKAARVRGKRTLAISDTYFSEEHL
ncbi:MAG: hypothetical protein QOD76_2168, partial [Solirubrobacteraceae bacterium]|nr:hypothetical protein [Solirubrobacteraceae bacterium]